jgi:hypothetical protein
LLRGLSIEECIAAFNRHHAEYLNPRKRRRVKAKEDKRLRAANAVVALQSLVESNEDTPQAHALRCTHTLTHSYTHTPIHSYTRCGTAGTQAKQRGRWSGMACLEWTCCGTPRP